MNIDVASAGADQEPFLPIWGKVSSVHADAGNCSTLHLEPPKGQVLPIFQPGQFAMLYAFGIGESAISQSGKSDENVASFTIRPVGATTRALASASIGDLVGVRGPYGQGWPMEELKGCDLVIMAGGLGLAPLRSVLMKASSSKTKPNRTALVYGARQPDEILFHDEMAGWAEAGIDIKLTVDRATNDWQGSVGLVTHLIPLARFDANNTVAFLCGPEVMMRFAAGALEDAGVPANRIWLSLERNMKCAIGHCGHCQFGAAFVCKDGPVFRFDQIRSNLFCREI